MIRALHTKKGFTLIELMIVVAIIGILAAIAIPNFLRFQAKSKQSEAKTNLGAIGTTAEAYRAERDSYGVRAGANGWIDLGWQPQGTPRYGYYYTGVSGAGVVTSTGVLASTPAVSALPCVIADPTTAIVAANTFLAGAEGQIDTDSTCDVWTYNELRDLQNPTNDVAS